MARAISTLRLWHLLALVAVSLCLFGASPAAAYASGLFAPEGLSGLIDFRLVAANGERAWTEGGFGKTRFDGSDARDWKMRPVVAEGEIVWQPRLSWSLGGTIVAGYQDDQDKPIDLVEAFLTLKPLPRGGTHLSARAGLYWPQISLEHQGAAWSVSDMITPSAINSWIGEEVKVIGAEATVTQDIGPTQLIGTIGLFGFNDTAGTLLAFRGWTLHDFKATAFGHQPLPPLNPFMAGGAQAAKTRPLIEIDDRPGFYGRLSVRVTPVTLSAFYYDNRGDPEAVTPRLQWGWDTRFWNLGARIDLSNRTRILAQALTGHTEMGYEQSGHYWVETRFRAAFVRISHDLGKVTLSARCDLFDTRERGSQMAQGESETGSAVTADASWKLSRHVNILAEILHVSSKRGSRNRIALDARQLQTVAQMALRLAF